MQYDKEWIWKIHFLFYYDFLLLFCCNTRAVVNSSSHLKCFKLRLVKQYSVV